MLTMESTSLDTTTARNRLGNAQPDIYMEDGDVAAIDERLLSSEPVPDAAELYGRELAEHILELLNDDQWRYWRAQWDRRQLDPHSSTNPDLPVVEIADTQRKQIG